MRLLLISDHESPYLWDYYQPGKLDGIDLILSAGDLKPEYLSFLVTMGRAPVFYVPGNHDGIYETRPPEGCDCIDGRLVSYKGLRILGLGGCPTYSGGPNQYSERQMSRKLLRAGLQIRRAGGLDILLTHAPAAGWGDGDDFAHRGFECLNPFIDRHSPAFHVHGHVHMNYGHEIARELKRNNTRVINAWERHIIEI